MKRLAAWLLFLTFVPSVALFAEPPAPDFSAEVTASFKADQQDLSQDDVNPVSGVLGRQLRAKSPVKSILVFTLARREISPASWIGERTFSPPKSSVYQQINVYRI